MIEIQFDEYAWHQEDVTTDGAISYSMVRLPATASLGTATATLLQAIGLRGRIGYDAVDDYVDANGIPSQFARVALKILYASPPDARF